MSGPMVKTWELIKNLLLEKLEPHGAIGEFCKKSGINRRTLTTWLKEGQVPSIEFIDQIAHGLGTTPDQLIKPPDDSIPLAKRELLSVISQLNDREIAMLGATITQLIESFRRVNGAHDRKKVDQG